MNRVAITVLIFQVASFQAHAEICIEGTGNVGGSNYPGCALFWGFEKEFSRFGLARPTSIEEASVGLSDAGSPMVQYRYWSRADSVAWNPGSEFPAGAWQEAVESYRNFLTAEMCGRSDFRNFVRAGGAVSYAILPCVVDNPQGEGVRLCRPEVNVVSVVITSCEAP